MGLRKDKSNDFLATVLAAILVLILAVGGVAIGLAIGVALTMPLVALVIIAANYFGAALPLTWTSVAIGSALVLGLRMLVK